MAPYTRGKKRVEELRFVNVTSMIWFGFKPKDLASLPGVSASDVTALGHILSTAVPSGKLKVVGASSPKPPRVTKRLPTATKEQQGSVSTFCSYNSLAAAQQAGWHMSKPRSGVLLRAPNNARREQTAIAELSDGSLYCFSLNQSDFTSFAAELGLKAAATITTPAERDSLVHGSSIPYPGRASKVLDNGTVFSSFFSTDKESDLLTANYDILSEEILLNPNPASGV